jgi:hypothetical protein
MNHTKTGMRAMRAKVTRFAGFTVIQSTKRLYECG